MDRMYALNQTIGDVTQGSKTYKAKQRGPELMSIKLGASTPRKHTRVMGQNLGSTSGLKMGVSHETTSRRLYCMV